MSPVDSYPSPTTATISARPPIEMSPHVDVSPASQRSFAILEEAEESQQTQTQTQTQMESTQVEFTQQSQELMADGSSNMTPLSPPPALPWGRLVPCVPSKNAPVDLDPSKSEYWLGRSSTKCDVAPFVSKVASDKDKKGELTLVQWAHSMISNRHCRIINDTNSGDDIIIEDASGNGTLINNVAHLQKGDRRILHSGDEICLVNPKTLRKKISSGRVLQAVLQHFSYIFVQPNKPRKSCVNPRAMNYHRDPQEQSSPRSSRRIEAHYDIREVLGDGTSGQVRRAIHRQTGQAYAVKVISLRRHLDTTSMEHEVSLLQSLDHPYIVQLNDVFVQNGVAMYLVMELVAGGDLFDRIVDQQRYTEVDARRVMRRLLSAVFYLHETKNIVHRDLKPENILCASPTHVKLADFGLAKIMESDGLKTFCGTPQYFAPEVLQRRHTVGGAGRYGKPADMWSLGVVLYILLTGRPPFGADIDEPQPFTLDFDDPIWKSMPLAQELVQQMLRMDPKRRLSVGQACDHPWINLEDGDTHIHPLDDPVVTARKRLFSEAEEKEPTEDETGSLDETNSNVSKESILSKEDFALAAKSHQRDNSIFHLESLECGENLFERAVGNKDRSSDVTFRNSTIPETQEDQDDESRDGGDPMQESPRKPNNSRDVETYMSIDGVEKEPNNERERPTTEEAPEPTTSPEGAAITKESSVTPDDCSPLLSTRSELSPTDRSNRFREQVLRQSNKNGESSPSPEVRRTGGQVAVTPTASNVSVYQGNCGEEQEEALDPILSQFSSGPSSLESFPESPVKAPLPVNEESKKRLLEEPEEPEAKRRNVKQTKQLTLKSWFVKK